VNANHDRWRRRSVREQTTHVVPDVIGTDALGVVADRAAAVAALSELTDRERRVVVLRFLVSLSRFLCKRAGGGSQVGLDSVGVGEGELA
jgi:DNA-directed RNA polymerase specialized sigma24 family protein